MEMAGICANEENKQEEQGERERAGSKGSGNERGRAGEREWTERNGNERGRAGASG